MRGSRKALLGRACSSLPWHMLATARGQARHRGLASLGLASSIAVLMVFACVLSVSASDEAVARVGDQVITRALLADAVQQALNSRYHHGALAGHQLIALERDQLEMLIRRDLSLLGGIDRGMALPVRDARESQNAIENRLGKARFENSLVSVGMSREDHLRALAETMLAERAYNEHVRVPAAVSDKDVLKAWNDDSARWRVPESVHVLHILLTVDADASAQEIVERRGEAQTLADRVRVGESFADLAAEHSEDMYRIKGGDLGWVHRNRLVEPLEQAVWSAEAGDLVGPVRSTDGYHLAQVVAFLDARQMTFDEVEVMLRQELETGRLREAEDRWFQEARNRHSVVILDPSLERGSE
ncbi:MAG: hypothetical protein GY906_27005 [bacterium]|nr:hypothetical protein [bacterium]